MTQRTSDWNYESFAAACRAWGLKGTQVKLMCLALEKPEVLRSEPVIKSADLQTVEGETCMVIDSSQRKLGQRFGVTGTSIDKAALRLESCGLLSRGTSGDGTRFVLCVSRLFDGPPEVEKTLPALPARGVPTGCQPRAPVSVNNNNKTLRDCVSASVSVDAIAAPNDGPTTAPNYWTDERLPWQRVTDGDVESLDLEMLRELFRESRKLRTPFPAERAVEFLAIAYHCARHHKLDGKRACVFVGRVKNRNWRGLMDEGWNWAKARMEKPKPPAALKSGEHATLGEVLAAMGATT